MISNPIKSIGIHEVVLSLYSDVKANIHINVAKSENEANEANKKFVNAKSKNIDTQANQDVTADDNIITDPITLG